MAHPRSQIHICRISVLFLFPITAAGFAPCGGPKKSPRTLSIVQIIFSFWSFEISEGILRNQKIIIGLDSFRLYLAPIWFLLNFVSTTMLKKCKKKKKKKKKIQ